MLIGYVANYNVEKYKWVIAHYIVQLWLKATKMHLHQIHFIA